MCGIVGYIGARNTIPVLVEGLGHLEYRGYDSAGVACLPVSDDGLEAQPGTPIFSVKEKGKLSALKDTLTKHDLRSHIGIGHTRWATHGEPSQKNAHPHIDYKKNIVLVHNGIIENHTELKAKLRKNKVRFLSHTDTEVASNLIGYYYQKQKKPDMLAAFKKAIKELTGFFAFVTFTKDDPDTLYVFKRSNPIVLGVGKDENFVASDVTALLPYTREVIYLEDDDLAIITKKKIQIFDVKTGKAVKRKKTVVEWDIAQAQKGGYPHFMLKEMYEQPKVLGEILQKRVDFEGGIEFDTLSKGNVRRLKSIERAYFVSCGTAHHAGIVGSYLFENFAQASTKVQVASEFRYCDPLVGKSDLVVLITQSGETADTLAALREAKAKGAMTLAVVNVVGSTMAREADAVIYTHAGPEIGVASTKAYVAQIMTLTLFAIFMGGLKKKLSASEMKKVLMEVKKTPRGVAKILKDKAKYKECAKKHYSRKNFLYLGRGVNFPTALEGALKLKEISYAHAHGYAAGEMKHGPIALIDHKQLVICIAPDSQIIKKMLSNVEEIRARDGVVITIGTEGVNSKHFKKLSDEFFAIPKTPELLSSIYSVIPLQFFAYYVAVFNGRDVDQPRNLAKSVTVE